MNRDTIRSKATLALMSMVAKVEKAGSIPNRDTVAAIDDALSQVTGMDFFGQMTKT